MMDERFFFCWFAVAMLKITFLLSSGDGFRDLAEALPLGILWSLAK
jgi:hypothetical protein